MSPLARLRQVVAPCLVFACFAGSAMFADPARTAEPPPRPAPAASSASSALPAPSGQSVQSPQPASAVTPASATPPALSASSVQSPQPTSTAGSASSAVPAPSASPAQSPQPVQLAPDVAAPIAHSALLTVEATATADALQLSIRRVSDKSLVNSDDVTVAVDGRNQSVTHEKGGGAYELPISDLRGDGARDVDVTVTHDGIREIVSGKVSVAEASSAGSLFRDHKQVAWWILNIVIVLVATMAFSRRKG
jgi:hypothetical protein